MKKKKQPYFSFVGVETEEKKERKGKKKTRKTSWVGGNQNKERQ